MAKKTVKNSIPFEQQLELANSSNRHFRIERDCATGETRVCYLTEAELAQAAKDAEEDTRLNGKRRLMQQAKEDASEYLLRMVAAFPDAPQSVKDYFAAIGGESG
jgi:hypothetical protein